MTMLGHRVGAAHPSHPFDVVVTALFFVTAGGWEAFEISLLIRDRSRGKGATGHDRGTRLANFVAIVGSLAAAGAVAGVRPLRTPAPHGVMLAGLVVMWAGLALRVWSISVLGGAFRTTVEVDPGQPVVTAGPYRWVRHPSYTGLLVIVAGFGLGLGNWLSVAICVLVPVAAIVRRIRVEEAEMLRVLGEDYAEYSARTKRLVPRLW